MHIMACIVVNRRRKNQNYIQHFRPCLKNLKFSRAKKLCVCVCMCVCIITLIKFCSLKLSTNTVRLIYILFSILR